MPNSNSFPEKQLLDELPSRVLSEAGLTVANPLELKKYGELDDDDDELEGEDAGMEKTHEKNEEEEEEVTVNGEGVVLRVERR